MSEDASWKPWPAPKPSNPFSFFTFSRWGGFLYFHVKLMRNLENLQKPMVFHHFDTSYGWLKMLLGRHDHLQNHQIPLV
jgi:hypothetical protein